MIHITNNAIKNLASLCKWVNNKNIQVRNVSILTCIGTENLDDEIRSIKIASNPLIPLTPKRNTYQMVDS